ncbi:autotransporter outer membrane beta-barrel domain-containing protein [Bradyrhizobium erythrophlei]|uniref:Outer membrane autotransporter barrel domain-containing protein n=1 Tax=Bradyrhizobium erythrophlei TaxID=1437360 RepID=A0A1M7U173_9BRAD|nr:autotransporter outer membrane beta-barrel domain-containing protein [Bradyrhizobium erythrophlei]SHN76759.1 outer membrane autotransporter barrel domain-containing protein [Bradyrhizobium erythrophlei]
MAVRIFNRACLRGLFAVSLALGAGLSGEASAQSASFNGTQATTFTLTTGNNTSTFTFGPNTVIGPTGGPTPGVTGDTLTGWNVINQGQINGGVGGGLDEGIFLNTVGGNSVINSGTITGGVNGGVRLDEGGSVTNLAGGTITGVSIANTGTVTNAGLIQGNVSVATGNIINQSGGTITGFANFFSTGTLTNAGTIAGDFTSSAGATVNNQSGGSIAGGVNINNTLNIPMRSPGTVTNAGSIGGFGVLLNDGGSVTNSGTITGTTANPTTFNIAGVFVLVGSANVSNLAGGAITGGTDGVQYFLGSGSVLNAGNITGMTGNGVNLQAGGSVTNLAGGTITGATNGVQVVGNNAFANSVINAGTITGTTGAGVSISNGAPVPVTNLAGGTITGTIGIDTNSVNATVINAGTITGTGGTAISFDGNTPSFLILRTGTVINGDVVSAESFRDSLILQGTGNNNNNFTSWESLQVQASGLWALNGVSSFFSTQVSSGTLVVGDASHPGASLTSSVQVNAGATLGGQGTVGTVTIANGGTIAPGAASPFSTLNVTGNTQFNVGSFFNVNVNAAGQTDKLAVGGTATLTGGTVQVLAQSANLTATNYTILTAGSPNGTTFAGVTTSSIFLSPTLSYPTPQEVDLTLTAKPFNTAAATPNQTAVANALNAGAQNALTAILFGQTSIAGAQQIFNALSGEVYGSVQNTQADETQFARNTILGRLRQSDSSGNTAALAFGGPELSYAASVDSSTGFAKAAADTWHDLTTWVQGLGGVGHVDADANGNAAALRSNFSGFLTGTDARFGAMRVGLMGGYTATNLNIDGRSSTAGINSALLGAYAGTSYGSFHLRGGAVVSFDSIDTSRVIAFPGFADSAKAHLDGYTGQAFGEVGYGASTGRIAIEPFAGLAYVRVHDAAFAENGGIAALSGSASNENIGYSSLGVRAGTLWTLPGGTVLNPHAALTWQHAFGDVTPTAALAFQNGGGVFSVAGVPIAIDSALVEGGVDWRITAQVKLGVEYQGELAQHAQVHTAKGKFTWTFF